MMEQLRTHCAKEISNLERNLGSQQELSSALEQTHPELVTEQGDTDELWVLFFFLADSVALILFHP